CVRHVGYYGSSPYFDYW
nr:immunoglobulin heavy chain junction region [Mus musculus]